MDEDKFEQIVGPAVKEIKDNRVQKAYGSLQPLAVLLVEWFERKITDDEFSEKGSDD